MHAPLSWWKMCKCGWQRKRGTIKEATNEKTKNAALYILEDDRRVTLDGIQERLAHQHCTEISCVYSPHSDTGWLPKNLCVMCSSFANQRTSHTTPRRCAHFSQGLLQQPVYIYSNCHRWRDVDTLLNTANKKKTMVWKQVDEPVTKKKKKKKKKNWRNRRRGSYVPLFGTIKVWFTLNICALTGRNVTQWLKGGTLRLCTTFVRQLNANIQGFSRTESLFFMTTQRHTPLESPLLSSPILAGLFSCICCIIPIWPHLITNCSLCWKHG